jgi:tRNA pseudouridine55 synthase
MLLNINKPAGLSSHDVVDKIRRITSERRVGHAGTLDPFATGVLVIGVSRSSTRKLGEISKNSQKEYLATMQLGQISSTGDLEGQINRTAELANINQLTNETIESALANFRGEITQTPPAYSALKINGTPAYKLARRGIKVQLAPRQVKIYELELVNFTAPCLQIKVSCSAGTYIRTLAEDIGKDLQLGGAYLTELTRTRVGEFKLEQSLTLEEAALFWQKTLEP